PISDEIRLRYPVTLTLAVLGTAVAALLGISVGIFAAISRGSFADQAIRSIQVLLLSVPEFLLATVALYALSVYLGWIPSRSYASIWDDPLTNLSQMAIPVLLLGTHTSAVIMRYTRSTILDVLGNDYVRTARAKGVRERAVIIRHVLRNALPAILTVLGLG